MHVTTIRDRRYKNTKILMLEIFLTRKFLELRISRLQYKASSDSLILSFLKQLEEFEIYESKTLVLSYVCCM